MSKNKITLRTLVTSNEALGELAGFDLPAKIAYKLSMIIHKISPAMEEYQKALETIIKKYGVIDEETGNSKIEKDHENFPKFEKDLEDLLNTEEAIDYNKISIDDLGDIKIKANTLLSLTWVFTEE